MSDTLTITDNRTGKKYELSIQYGTYPTYGASIHGIELRKIKATEDDFGLLSYDPAFMNTASCKSAIAFIDGERGILRYRGYPIEELAKNSNYLEVAYLILNGELPNESQYNEWTETIIQHEVVHENVKKIIDGFHYDAHPMGILISTIAALSTFHPEAKQVLNKEIRYEQIAKLISKMPTLAAFAYRHSIGRPYTYPDEDFSYTANFLSMMFKKTAKRYVPHPTLEHALDVLFILHVDHEQNCSANAMRSVGSSLADPYVSLAAASAALYGPLHGGANEQVLRMLGQIGDVSKVPDYIKQVKAGEVRLMGFGHRVYKHYDPRAKILKDMAPEIFEVTGKDPLLDIALELERVALEDDYFVTRNLYPNVDFYSGIIYKAMGFPVEMFPVLFAIPRTSGWLAQWQEMLNDSDQKIARPRQVYIGEDQRAYIPIEQR